MARSQVALATTGSWIVQLREALANPNITAFFAALAAGWQQTVRGAPDDAIMVGIIGTMVAVADEVAGSLNAYHKAVFKLRTCIWMLADKLAARFGIGVLVLAIGYKLHNPWAAIVACLWTFLTFEALSLIRHLRSLRKDSPGEIAYLDALLEIIGKWGQAIHDAKTPKVIPEPVHIQAAPNGGA